MMTITHGSPAPTATQHQPVPQQHSTWRSPVPYLFGGLAAMMGLIAFALLLLACSYWRLSGYLEEGSGRPDGDDLESGGVKPDDAGASKDSTHPPEQRIVVIMAGDEKPTFLATPVSSRASSFGDNARRGSDEDGKSEAENRTESGARGDDHVSVAAEDGGLRQESTQENQEGAQQNHDRRQDR